VKNCDRNLRNVFGTREFMENLEELVENRETTPEVRRQALELVQQWGDAFAGSRSLYFNECYLCMKARGVRFPPKKAVDMSLDFDQKNAPFTTSQALNPAQELVKLKLDLVCVQEKIELCQEMLPHSPGIEHDEILWELIGFLEACQPRLLALIQAGSSGILDESIMEACLKLNDALIRTLTAEKEGTPIAVEKVDLGFGLESGQEGISPRANPLDRSKFQSTFSIADDDNDDEYEALAQGQIRLTATTSQNASLDDDLKEFESFLNSRP
jgi:hypothetical protein